MKNFLRAFALTLTFAVHAQAWSANQEILTMSAAEEAGGVTQDDFDIPVLKMLERRTVEMLESKMKSYLATEGIPSKLPKIKSEAHYMELNETKLAVVRLHSPQSLNQVFLYGIKGDTLLRVVCVRTKNFEKSIPISHGPCGEKIHEVFGISLGIK